MLSLYYKIKKYFKKRIIKRKAWKMYKEHIKKYPYILPDNYK